MSSDGMPEIRALFINLGDYEERSLMHACEGLNAEGETNELNESN